MFVNSNIIHFSSLKINDTIQMTTRQYSLFFAISHGSVKQSKSFCEKPTCEVGKALGGM